MDLYLFDYHVYLYPLGVILLGLVLLVPCVLVFLAFRVYRRRGARNL